MTRRTCGVWAALLVLGAVPFAGAAEDDLAVVKKAVSSPPPEARSQSATPASQAKRGDEPRWLKLRIEDRGAKKAKVSVNLPLDLVRALDEDGEELPLLHGRRDGKGKTIRLRDVLRALQSVQDVVQIEDESSVVRIWVE